ncbi:MAG: cadmium resistance transporter [Nitrososphaeraceae archaeon]
MLDFFNLILIGITAFVASNIDDTFILILLFSSGNFHARQIFIGQFIGIAVLIIISTMGSLISLLLPSFIIGLMGLIPMAIGIKRIVELQQRKPNNGKNKTFQDYKRENLIPFLTVSAITIANGGDDIGVFTPLFAKYNTVGEVTTLVTIFMAMTLVWCILTYYFVNHPLLSTRIQRFGNLVTPFVLMGLGLYILVDAFFI